MSKRQAINAYIAFRRPNWLDYARWLATTNHFAGWEEDLLQDIILDLLAKDENKLFEMMERTTRKIVNGRATCELDKFVLSMLKTNARSATGSFRRRTLGHAVISKKHAPIEIAQHVDISEARIDKLPETEYDNEHKQRIDAMHEANMAKLQKYGFNAKAIAIYRERYIHSTDAKDINGADTARHIENIEKFLLENNLKLEI